MNRGREFYSETTATVRCLLGILIFVVLWPAAGTAVSDADADLVPDAFDNCSIVPNGPNQGSNQVDTDQDGYGNACDADYDNDFLIATPDYAVLLGTLTDPGAITDHDGNGIVTVTDFAEFLRQFQAPFDFPGPSGLACAGTVPCVP